MFDHDSIPARKWASNLPVSHTVGHSILAVDNKATDDVADIYNRAGDDYVSYADGDPSQPFAFDGMHAYADRCVWAVLEKKLTDLWTSGASSVRHPRCGLRTRYMAEPTGHTRTCARIQQHYRAWIRHRTGANTTGAVGDPKSFQSSWSESHIRGRGPCGPVAGSRCLRRSDSLPVQRAQPSACCALAGYLKRNRARHVGIFHNDGPSDWQHSNGLCRFDRESPPIKTRSRQGPLRNRPQRRPTYCIQFSPVYSGRIAELFRQRFRHRGFARPRPVSQSIHAGSP